jgi:hypothetical protein
MRQPHYFRPSVGLPPCLRDDPLVSAMNEDHPGVAYGHVAD